MKIDNPLNMMEAMIVEENEMKKTKQINSKMSYNNHHRHHLRQDPTRCHRRRLVTKASTTITRTTTKHTKSWPHHLILVFSYSMICAFTLISYDGHHNADKQQANFKSLIGLAEASQTPPLQLPQAQRQVSALNSNNLYQAMSQMFQVFNGNDSSQLDANHFKLLELIDEDTLLVGARNVVYNLSLTTFREQRRLVWIPDKEDARLCKIKGKTLDQCQNYIRVIKRLSPNLLLVCGTNAFKPKCRQYSIEESAYELVEETLGEGVCPYQETQNVTSIYTDGHLYSATAAQFNGADHLIHRQPLRTEQFNPKQLNLPNFVHSFRYGEHVYFLFREIATEHINCGKTIYSRIARVCVNDSGGTTTRSRERWTSFSKARLTCSIPGDFPFNFDEIQASTNVLQSAYLQPTAANPAPQTQSQDLIYAVFTTPVNSIGGSAICAYRMADVLAAFDGPFKSQADGNSFWLPVPESKVPQPRPGNCAVDSRRLPEETINFIKDNPLMDTPIAPIWSQPLITMASINFRFTQIVVDPQVETQQVFGAPSMRTDVIFVSTDDGRVLKLINTYHLTASHQVHKLLGSSPPPTSSSSLLPTSQPTASPQMASSLSMAGLGGGPSAMPHRPMAQVSAGPPAKPAPEPLPDVSANTIVIEELHLFDQRTPITGLLIHKQPTGGLSSPDAANDLDQQPAYPGGAKLVVMSAKQIKAIPLSRCERALSCADCLALFDPYCAWDLQQQACLATGRSIVIGSGSGLRATPGTGLAVGPAQFSQFGPPLYQQYQLSARASSPPLAWGPNIYQQPSLMAPANNHTLAWWSSAASCPASAHQSAETGAPLPQQVGTPFRSLFASHLQVPSRFDYQSGHHLSRTSLVALPQMTQISSTSTSTSAQTNSGGRVQQPVSECLTLCGGVYAPPMGALGGQSPSSSSDNYLQQQQHPFMSCADYFASASNSLLIQQQLNGGTNQQNLYTSENLKWAVIICALLGLCLGLVFGFAIGKSTKSKNESSICSSTFDETNLYMASTGSHGCHMTANGLFAPHLSSGSSHHQNSTVARLTNHPAFMASQAPLGSNGSGAAAMAAMAAATNNYSLADNHHQTPNGHMSPSAPQSHHQLGASGRNQSANMFDATQSLLGVASDHSSGIGSSTYANQQQQQQQMLFHKNNNSNNHERSPSVRTGALPPIPTSQHQPLVLANNQAQTTHLNQSQLTPNSSTASQQTTSSSNSSGSQTTLQANEQHHQQQQQQQFFLNQHQLNNSNNNQPNNLHQRSFTNSSTGSGAGGGGGVKQQQAPLLGAKQVTSSTFLHSAQQQQQPNNKIYL